MCPRQGATNEEYQIRRVRRDRSEWSGCQATPQRRNQDEKRLRVTWPKLMANLVG